MLIVKSPQRSKFSPQDMMECHFRLSFKQEVEYVMLKHDETDLISGLWHIK